MEYGKVLDFSGWAPKELGRKALQQIAWGGAAATQSCRRCYCIPQSPQGVGTTMQAQLWLGDEAVGQAALDAGIGGAFSYPGTPSTEIFEHILEAVHGGAPVAARWSANEKVAYEEALGMSYVGRRALVSMKHVGLNVAADPFINSAVTGINGGLVLAVADDPSMHSSQNEQDSRYYAEFAKIPVFEPADQQEAYDFTRRAFLYSEEVGLPVMVRLVTRLAHSRSNVVRSEPEDASSAPRREPDPNEWTLVPANARRRFAALLEAQPRLLADSEGSDLNTLSLRGPRGVVACGIAYNYLAEVLGTEHDRSVLRLAMYPIASGLLRQLVDHCDEILVLEDGYPFVEKRLTGLLGVPGKAIGGRLNGALPATGELSPDGVARGLGLEAAQPQSLEISWPLAGRPPQLCRGCPHADTFKALTEAVAGFGAPRLFGDIGCYTLGVMPPFRAIHSCVDMGASIAMAHGASQGGAHPVIATIGDSTFAHSGMTGLLGAASADANMTLLVLDNAAVAMTGCQDTMLCDGKLVDVIRALGVRSEHVHVIDPIPKHHANNVALMRSEIEHRGMSVIIPRRPCVQLPAAKRRSAAPALCDSAGGS